MPLIHYPALVCERSWRFHSSRRTSDLVDRALREAHDMEGVKADLGVGDRVLDRLLVAAGHVERHGLDRVLAVPEQVEELLQSLGVAAGGAPHDPLGLVVDDGSEVALPAAVADLVHADVNEVVGAVMVDAVGDDPVSHPMCSSRVIGVLAICWASHATTSSKSRV